MEHNLSNKSKEFAIKRIADGDILGYGSENEWQDSSVLVTPQIATFTDSSFLAPGLHSVTVKYDPDADFEYCVCDTVIYDGTLLFYIELFYGILQKIISAQTFNKDMIPNGFEGNGFKYDIYYAVGDFIYRTEHGEFSSEKPWLRSKTMAMLPIKAWAKVAEEYQ